MKRNISIIGSTGSIGCSTLDVVRHLGNVSVRGLASGRNMDLLAKQVHEFAPDVVSTADEQSASELLELLRNLKIEKIPEIFWGENGLVTVATHPDADAVVSATVGATGFIPTLRAIEQGKRIALANKETLVMAGELMMAAAAKSGAEILPVDSEHNAIHQCLRGESRKEIRRLILTASGGPFRNKTKAEIACASVDEALNHPNWKMGNKITIDSATLMNKGLEVIEAKWLFGFEADSISVIVHPQSVIHSMVELVDGSVMAQLGVTDMKHAIQYAITYPERLDSCLEPLDFKKASQLTFEEPDLDKFPCLALAYRALCEGGTMPAAMNAANEVAVQAFLEGQISLDKIAKVIEAVMDGHHSESVTDLEAILVADTNARASARDMLRI